MKIYAIRHGQTDPNLKRIVQGWTDHPLNEHGILQAHALGHFLKAKQYQFTHIISSPLIRSIKTAEIIQSILESSLDIEVNTTFIERNFGVFEGNSVDETMKVIYQKGFKKNGYEHDEALLQRIQLGISELYLKYPNGDILLSCHSHVSKSLLILSDPINYDYQTWLNNASMCVFEYDGKSLKTLAYNIEYNQK